MITKFAFDPIGITQIKFDIKI